MALAGGSFDIVTKLMERDQHYVLLGIFQNLDFSSLRRCLWVSQSWRRFIFNNMDKLNFEDREREHNIDNKLTFIDVPIPPMLHVVESDISRFKLQLYNEDCIVFFEQNTFFRLRRNGKGGLTEVKSPARLREIPKKTNCAVGRYTGG